MNIRNFCIIAHIDHGKSTLADRFLEFTGTIKPEKMEAQYLDRLELERERGITIKMAPVRMLFKNHILNLIDTPGHVDFSYEVSRALAAVEGVILLVDATQGIQAQTLANLEMAKKQNLKVIGAINKIDLVDSAMLDEKVLELAEVLNIETDQIFQVSAKTGRGVGKLLAAVLLQVPSPSSTTSNFTVSKALIFDSHYDSYRGVIAHSRIFSGAFTSSSKCYFAAKELEFQPKEIGYFIPHLIPTEQITAGEIGYIATGLKNPDLVGIGDTIISMANHQETIAELQNLALPGYKEPTPVVFAGFFPAQESDYHLLKEALGKYRLNDSSLAIEDWYQEGLGRGFRLGFLGLLHLEITQERLQREIGIETVVTFPSVAYNITLTNGIKIEALSAAQLPDASGIKSISEPWIELEILTPKTYLSTVMDTLKYRRGQFKLQEYFGGEKLKIRWEMPLSDFIGGFYDDLKSASSGFASLNYKLIEPRIGDLVRVDILIADKIFNAFSRILPRETAESQSRQTLLKLKEVLPRENFSVALQAVIGGKIIARETIPAMRKDVTGYLYGGDRSRKMKLWQKQAKGKKRLKAMGNVNISTKTVIEILKAK